MNDVQATNRPLTGRVVRNATDKTITVLVERRVKHPIYGKYLRRTTKLVAHDEDNACRIGDKVAVSQCRPISKRKSWMVVAINGKSTGASL